MCLQLTGTCLPLNWPCTCAPLSFSWIPSPWTMIPSRRVCSGRTWTPRPSGRCARTPGNSRPWLPSLQVSQHNIYFTYINSLPLVWCRLYWNNAYYLRQTCHLLFGQVTSIIHLPVNKIFARRCSCILRNKITEIFSFPPSFIALYVLCSYFDIIVAGSQK